MSAERKVRAVIENWAKTVKAIAMQSARADQLCAARHYGDRRQRGRVRVLRNALRWHILRACRFPAHHGAAQARGRMGYRSRAPFGSDRPCAPDRSAMTNAPLSLAR